MMSAGLLTVLDRFLDTVRTVSDLREAAKGPKVKGRGRALKAPPRAKVTSADLRGASKSWDTANPDAAGLLEAEVVEQ